MYSFSAWRVRRHRSHASLFLGGGSTVTGHSGDKSANVGRSHIFNAIPLWDLVEMQLGMLVDSNCDDPLAHCAAQEGAVGL